MREFTDGSAAIVRGALDAGCTFFAGYPITPASPILMQMMRGLPKVNAVAVMGEDEIASIGMCIGATVAGWRAMTATSRPGLSLYSENIGLAIIGEVPLVIVDVQRLGPATGGATTVGQGDVQFVRWGTAGGYPVIALAPSTVAECYSLTRRAFDLAERFRCPVFFLTDKELNMTTTTVEVDDYEKPPVRERAVLAATEPPYRYLPAADVSPSSTSTCGRRSKSIPTKPNSASMTRSREPRHSSSVTGSPRARCAPAPSAVIPWRPSSGGRARSLAAEFASFLGSIAARGWVSDGSPRRPKRTVPP